MNMKESFILKITVKEPKKMMNEFNITNHSEKKII